ncbi:MAG TPA: UDP-N-acetylmuramoyl-L-alanyl-D-glutamate--2,6-diaminopimelate ligase [Burkholderiales bacterium]|nr:UDP-N-acetylmuramoyl-L-alanyl-D-glutamate--2,6-diaminopimelate ligase [Burkholderiales bacterium]
MSARARTLPPARRPSAPIDLQALGITPTGLSVDSRKITAGEVFIAFPGETSDGRRFIAQAIEAGAAAVLWEQAGFEWDPRWPVPNVPVRGLRQQAGEIASHFYGNPSQHLWMIGVTGTNGKTSCSQWIAQSLSRQGRRTAVIGTLGSGFADALDPTLNTTPDPVSLQARLAALREQGAAAVAMDVSSHGLEQGRVNGVQFDVALFTNLSRDHLDYHGSMDAYAAAKAKLFDWPQLKHAVLNLDDAFGAGLAARIDRSRVNVVGYGLGKGEIAGHQLDLSTRGLKLEIATPWGEGALASPLLGGFNAYNLLGVLGVLVTSDVHLQDAIVALSELQPVAGRMQTASLPGAPLVVVDYAHSPDALEKALETLRMTLAPGARLHCVFGCGGERDPGKRPLMGEIATRLADRCVITSDNPRSENPRAIIEDILAGAHPNYHVEEDRAAAILNALRHASPTDVVLIAGKGHESYQEIDSRRLPFDDLEVAREVVARLRDGAQRV